MIDSAAVSALRRYAYAPLHHSPLPFFTENCRQNMVSWIFPENRSGFTRPATLQSRWQSPPPSALHPRPVRLPPSRAPSARCRNSAARSVRNFPARASLRPAFEPLLEFHSAEVYCALSHGELFAGKLSARSRVHPAARETPPD